MLPVAAVVIGISDYNFTVTLRGSGIEKFPAIFLKLNKVSLIIPPSD